MATTTATAKVITTTATMVTTTATSYVCFLSCIAMDQLICDIVTVFVPENFRNWRVRFPIPILDVSIQCSGRRVCDSGRRHDTFKNQPLTSLFLFENIVEDSVCDYQMITITGHFYLKTLSEWDTWNVVSWLY